MCRAAESVQRAGCLLPVRCAPRPGRCGRGVQRQHTSPPGRPKGESASAQREVVTDHAMLEVRVRIPAPAPVSSDSACTPRATSAHDVGATALRACAARCELMKTQRTCGGAAVFPIRHLAVNEAPQSSAWASRVQIVARCTTHWAMHKSAAVPCKHSRRRALLRWSTT